MRGLFRKFHATLDRMGNRRVSVTISILCLVVVGCHVDDPSLRPASDPRFEAPPPELRDLGRDPLRNVFFGDLHIHTAYSADAWTLGVRAMPDDAYTFTKGGTIQHAAGYPIRASRPLDFSAVTDHAEYLGVPRSREAGTPAEAAYREAIQSGNPFTITLHFFRSTMSNLGDWGEPDPAVSKNAWDDIVETAERHNEPGRFSTFAAYEWTSMPDADNLHRNVVYRSNRVPEYPFTAMDSDNPEDLWRALEEQRAQGIESIAIPHNANVSNGKMYARETFGGAPVTAEYAATRMRNEPISEIFQVKGSSETHPVLSTEDEFAAFEVWDQTLSASSAQSEPRGSYVRDALRTGLEMSAGNGFNPYRFGFIGSSDSHNASSSVEESDHHGKLPMLDGTAGLRLGQTLLLPDSQNRGLKWSAAGLAAVWAEENTRAALFDAMRRKETYATSGPRITVRFFGGWDFDEALANDPGVVEKAYQRGVPMGGDLPPAPGIDAPRFLVLATKDPIGANLDRAQIVKGWVDADGASHERVYDLAASDGRVIDPATHRAPAVGTTVDLATASFSNDIGAAQLDAVWTDPDFDPKQEAFYYARVIEIPTPRWSTYDAVAFGVEPPEPSTIQERAVTSSIWYAPPA